MTEAERRAARMFDAINDLERRERQKLTLGELGARVAKAEGRAEPYAPAVVRRWVKGLAEPSSIALWRAIGEVLGVSPSYLAFGEGTAPEPPAEGRVIPHDAYRPAQPEAAAPAAEEAPARRRRSTPR